ncbi:MAG TPA: hypothetical protein VFP00_03955 [Burkholderiales bacterium]|nr:hypothetical protein [Burkholderiales bacterium]
MKPQVFVLLAAVIAFAVPGLAAAEATDTCVPTRLVDTRAALRDLWLGHIFWVRNVVDAQFAGDVSAANTAEQQVVTNAQAIAGAIEPYYGKAASEQLFTLLAGHWGAVRDYLNATRSGSTTGQDAAFKQLVDNAGEIATFLSGANPNWPVDTLRGLLTAHGSHHVKQIQQFQAKQYEEEAKTWSAMTSHMYVIADALAAGLAKQFPEKFQ